MDKNKPLVTIITTTYNLLKAGREAYFSECIDSVQTQTYKNIEHIIIDGASTDGTIDLIKEYAEKGIVEYFSEPDEGIYDAFNKGALRANGKYIAFLNSDDFYHDKNGIEKTVKLLEKNNADFSYASWIQLERNGKKKIKQPNLDLIFLKMPFCHQTMIVRKDLVIKEGMFDTKFKLAADYDLTLRLVLQGYNSIKNPLCFTTFRQGGESSFSDRLLNDEYSQVMHKNYSELFNISMKECRNLQQDRIITRDFFEKIYKLTKKQYRKNLISAFVKLKIRRIRRELIVIRTKKGMRIFMFFGKTIFSDF